MRLRRLDLTRYGKFTDYSIDFGERATGAPDLHIVYGLNEAGKSTSLSAYLDLLFGIEERTRYAFLHQGKAMEVGGSLEFGGQTREVRRIKQRKDSLLDGQGHVLSEALLSVPLAGLNRDSYKMMFSLDDETLELGGNAILESKGDLGQLLFSASAGLADISAILEKVSGEADEIFRKRASSTRIATLKKTFASLKDRRNEIDTLASAHGVLVEGLTQAQTAYDEAVSEISVLRARHDELSRLQAALPIAVEQQHIADQLRAYSHLPHPPKGCWAELNALLEDDTRLRTKADGLDQAEARLMAELEQIQFDDQILKIVDDIDLLTQAMVGFSGAERDLPKRRLAHQEQAHAVRLILANLGKPEAQDPASLLVPAPLLADIQERISAYSGVEARLNSALAEQAAAATRLEEARAAAASSDGEDVSLDFTQTSLVEATVARIRQGNTITDLRSRERELPERLRALEAALAPLQPWGGNVDRLAQLFLPDATLLESWRTSLSDCNRRRSELRHHLAELVSTKEQNEARVAAISARSGAISDLEADAALSNRNEAWQRHRATLDAGTADVFEEKMTAVDRIATDRLTNAKQLAELRSIETLQATTIAAIGKLQVDLDTIEVKATALRNEIRSGVSEQAPLPEGDTTDLWLSRLDQWNKARNLGLLALDALRQTEGAVQALSGELAQEHGKLAAAISSTGFASGDHSLEDLVHLAERLLLKQAATTAKRKVDAENLASLTRNLEQRNLALAAANADNDRWRNGWDAAVGQTWFAEPGVSVTVAKALVGALTDLPAALASLKDLGHRIEAMERDQAEFMQLVERLSRQSGTALQGPPMEAAKVLVGRKESAQRHRDQRLDKQKSLDRIRADRGSLGEDLALHSARASNLIALFEDTGTLVDVRKNLDRCETRDRLRAEQVRLEGLILREMRSETLDAALLTLEALDVEGLSREHAELTQRLADLEGRSRQLYADKSAAEDRLKAIGGDDAVARVEAQRKTTLLEIEDLALRYMRLRAGSLLADHALHAYRDKHRSAMMGRASRAFESITRGEYTGLATRPEKDKEALIGLSKHGGSKLAVDMSKGTRFQLYLALRLAGYDEFAALRPSVPFIADDIMETFDEPRSEEVFRLLGEMASVGQVIYLTHHRHLCEIAKEVVPSVRVHEIA